jgi:esterase
MSFVLNLPKRSASLELLKEALDHTGFKAVDYFSESAFEDEQGWGFRFDIEGMVVSSRAINGDWWNDWLASTCPMLLIHGAKSWLLKREEAEQMQKNRPNTRLEIFEDCGHGVHCDDVDGFYRAVKTFLKAFLQ